MKNKSIFFKNYIIIIVETRLKAIETIVEDSI